MSYKYWIFYIKKEYIEDIPFDYLWNQIYAYTDDKKYAKEFESWHDMNKFVKKEVRLSREEVHILTEDVMSKYLQPYCIITEGKKRRPTKIRIIATKDEKRLVDSNVSMLANNIIIRNTMQEPHIYKYNLFEALSLLKYPQIHSGTDLQINTNYVDTINVNEISIDELAVYIDIFESLLKK